MPSTDLLFALYLGVLSVGLLVGALVLRRRRAALDLALSFCRRSEDGTMYIADPKTGTLHRLDDLIARRRLGPPVERSPRQQRKLKRSVRRAIRA